MDQITHSVRRQNWLKIIKACQNRPADMSAHQWLVDNDIKEKAYYYWLRKFRKETAQSCQLPSVCTSGEVDFVELPLPGVAMESSDINPNSTVTIRKNGMTIEISNSVSGQLLSLLLQEVSHA